MRLATKRALSYVFAFVLVSLVAMNFMTGRVFAYQVVIDHYKPYNSSQTGHSGDEATASADLTTGYVKVHVARNSYAHALVMGQALYTGSNLNQIAIYITIKSSTVSKDSWGLSSVKLWVWIYDQTTGTQIWEGFQDWVAADSTGKTLYWTGQSVNINYNHQYNFWAGIQARSWTSGFFQGWADADGTIYRIYATQWPQI